MADEEVLDRIGAVAAGRSWSIARPHCVQQGREVHAHPLESRDPRGTHELMLSFGITGCRRLLSRSQLEVVDNCSDQIVGGGGATDISSSET